jgi:alpha-amylase
MKNIHHFFALTLFALLLASCGGSGASVSSGVSSEGPSSSTPSSSSPLSSSVAPQGYVMDASSNEGGSAFYEIFVGSFCDSNNDGVGDLNGITSKLDYLQNLGVSYLWLTPVHPSPSYHKYDVKDYYAIDSSFGTLDDFKTLVSSAKTHHIGIVMDMVFNHASSKSSWFSSFVSDLMAHKTSSDTCQDDFVWARSATDGYSYNADLGAYVESRFSETMPEFNLDSTHVRSEMTKIMKYWLDLGVAGFRYDACTYYYYNDVTKNVAFMKWLVETVQAYKAGTYQVGEAWVGDQNTLNSYAGSGMHVFNFPTAEGSAYGSMGYLEGYADGPKRFGKNLPLVQSGITTAGGIEPAFFVSNHDQDRWGSYFSGHGAAAEYERKVTVSAYLLTPGTPFMYYGEEIQMRGIRGDEQTDAARRQAMLWGEGESKCKQPENFTYANQVTLGVKEALADGWSMVNHYRKVLSVRNKFNDVFQKGTYAYHDFSNSVICAFDISYSGKSYLLIHNVGSSTKSLTLASNANILADVNTSKSLSSVDGTSLTIQGYASILLGA